MGRLRDFASINAYFSDREIEELQAAVDARREARTARADQTPPRQGLLPPGAAGPGSPKGARRAR